MRKLLERPDPLLRGRDSNMRLVDFSTRWLGRCLVFEYIFFRCRRVPEARVIHGRDGKVLSDTFDPGGQTFDSLAAWDYK